MCGTAWPGLPHAGKPGANGDSNGKRGGKGGPLLVRVPCGTVVKEVRRAADGGVRGWVAATSSLPYFLTSLLMFVPAPCRGTMCDVVSGRA